MLKRKCSNAATFVKEDGVKFLVPETCLKSDTFNSFLFHPDINRVMARFAKIPCFLHPLW